MGSDNRGGLLTKGQREFLSEEYQVGNGGSTERVKRSRIRERVRNGLLDLQLVAESLDPSDRQKIFDDLLGEGAGDGEYNIENGKVVRDVLEFLYLGVTEYGSTSESDALFEELFEAAVETGEWERGNAVKTVDVEVETELVLPWENLQSYIDQRGVTPRAKRSLEYHLKYNKEDIDIGVAREYLDEFYGIA